LTQNPTPFACGLSAIAPADRPRHIETIESLFRAVVKIEELEDGFSFELPQDDDQLRLALTFIARERLCCPFFDFRLRVEAAGQKRRLDITGSTGVKPQTLF